MMISYQLQATLIAASHIRWTDHFMIKAENDAEAIAKTITIVDEVLQGQPGNVVLTDNSTRVIWLSSNDTILNDKVLR